MTDGVSCEPNGKKSYVEDGTIGDGGVSGGVGGLDDGSYDHGRAASHRKRAGCRQPWSHRHGKGRQGQQVPVHLLLRWARRAHQRHERRLSNGDGEDDRPGRCDGDPRRGPRRKADRGQVRRARGSHAAGVGDRSYRGCHPRFPQAVRRGPAPTGVRQPMHGQVHEGHPGPTSDPALRAEWQDAVQPGGDAGRRGVQGRPAVRQSDGGRHVESRRQGGTVVPQGPSG